MYIYLRKNILNNSLARIFFISFSLLSLITFGTIFFKYVMLIIFTVSIFYLEIKNLNKFIIIINSIAILIILLFVKLSTMALVICFFLFYGFFKFKINFTNVRLSKYNTNKIYILILIIFLISVFYNLKPQQENYFINITFDFQSKTVNPLFKLVDDVNSFPNKKENESTLVSKFTSQEDIAFSERCISHIIKDKIIIKDKCNKLSNLVRYNRISINNLDPNIFSLILMFVMLFSLKIFIPEEKFFLFFSSIIFFVIIEYLTKSRVLFVYFSLYIFFEYIIKIKTKNILSIFLSFNLIVFLLSFFINYLYNIFDFQSTTINPLFRLIDIFDESIKIRFSNIANSLIYYFQNFDVIFLPGSEEHFNSTQDIHKYNNYSPHNFLLALIKDYGLIVTLIITLNIKNLYEENSSNNFLSLLLSVSFLGYSILFIFIFILFERVFNFKV